MTHHLLQPLLITALVVTEVGIWQLRIALATRGHKRVAAALGAMNALLSVAALAQVVTHMDRPANVAGYAVGVAMGVYLGIAADEWLATDWLEYRLYLDEDADLLASRLRELGWRVTQQPVVGPSGPADLLHVAVSSRRRQLLEHDLDRLAPLTPRTTSRLTITNPDVAPQASRAG